MENTLLLGMRNEGNINMNKQVKKNIILFFMTINIVLSSCGTKDHQEKNRTQVEVADGQAQDDLQSKKTEHIAEQQEADENLVEEDTGEQSVEQNKETQSDEEKEPIPENAKELLDDLFDYLHPDKSNMVDIELYETENELYYKWKSKEESGEWSNSYVLEYMFSSEDGEDYGYTAYSLVPYKDENGKEEYVQSYGGYWKMDSATGEIISDAKEYLEYLFDYMYPDQSYMVDLELHETEDRLYYKWKTRSQTGEISNPCVLEYSYSTEDGMYHNYAVYGEVWETYHDDDGNEHKIHVRDSYGDFILVNTESLDVITRWIPNEDKDSEPDYVENEKYYEILHSYAEDKE